MRPNLRLARNRRRDAVVPHALAHRFHRQGFDRAYAVQRFHQKGLAAALGLIQRVQAHPETRDQ